MAESCLCPIEQAVLAERIRAGVAVAEEGVVRLFYPRVLATLVCRTHDRENSRDPAQEVLIAALRARRAG